MYKLLRKVLWQVCSVVNYYYQGVSVFHHAKKQIQKPASLISFSPNEQVFLEKCAYSFNYAVDYSRGFRQKEFFTVQLCPVTFLGNSGALIFKNKVVIESVFDQLRLTKSPAFRSPAWLLGSRKKGVYTSIMHLPWAKSSNYHWFLDCLPRLFLILSSIKEPVKLIIPANMPAFQYETLQFLLPVEAGIDLVKIKKNEKWTLTSFILPSFISDNYSGYLPIEFAEFLRNRIWSGYEVVNQVSKKRIYISRGKATKRRVINELEVVRILKEYNIEEIFAEDLTYQQQVQLFYNAELVVAPHGAGLTNILFCAQTIVIELHPSDIVKSHYFMLSKGLGFEYYYSIGSSSDESLNFKVDVVVLTSILKQIFD